jgi:hypothetical protein
MLNHFFPKLKYAAVNIFIVLNLCVIAFANKPDFIADAVQQFSKTNLSPQTDYRLRLSGWYLKYYGYLVGLDNKWQMFGRQSRFNWWYVVRGEYSDGTTTQRILMPTSFQSARTLPQRLLFDLKENKIQLNMYNNAFAREAYSRYLARQFPEHNGLPIRAVLWELAHQKIIPPAEAVAQQKLREDKVHIRSLNRFELPDSILQNENEALLTASQTVE